ncbi:NAD(P)-dependent dehydrogenase (short-subunit alcohol dehydrogenase family) [Kitasatospora sp. MAP12-15]|uniref:SDR family oxidoreductase n=1 Tax=unclassified Kitasatospora TaxID=2633591 RepID=UPI0024734514|nr:SDR family oxidoreductase [Kitasatospora sp. MAP12-44]MDH6112514.1 NAD(P)-dependent dehydrogenase (short-subunit alcohol dehydrogenase family) [Kitasatospora sp. MAP12-44]
MNAFEGQRVLVVGGTSGVGLATAAGFAAAGAAVTVVSRSQQKIDEALKSLGDRAQGRTLDIRDDEEVERFLEAAGAFDHVVVSAGVTPTGRADTLPLDDAYAAMDSKFWGAYRISRKVSIRSGGSLTLVSGYLSVRPSRASALQSAINAALEALARGLALEYAPIRVNAVSPGLIKSPLWDGLAEANRETMYEGAAQRLPVGRVGRPEDVAEAILYLAGNGYSTGTTVFVDGGGSIA